VSPDPLDRLYGADRDDFVSERNALAKELHSEGKREEAEEVRRLKKPSISVWALNQGVRSDPKAAKKVLSAADRMESAQADALKGKGGKLRAAHEGEQEAVDGMLAAVQAASGEKLSGATLDRVRETLRSIAGNEERRAEFEAGRVTSDHRVAGFAGELAAVPKGARKRTASATRQQRDAKRRIEKATKERDAAQRLVEGEREALSELEDQTRRAKRRVKEAEARLSKAESELKKAEKKS
jgi:hypothetical protein